MDTAFEAKVDRVAARRHNEDANLGCAHLAPDGAQGIQSVYGGEAKQLRLGPRVAKHSATQITKRPCLSGPVQASIQQRHEAPIYGNHVDRLSPLRSLM